MKKRRRPGVELLKAFDEARFGELRTLNLRATLPSPQEAAERADMWLRERLATLGGEVLIITGRGNASADGVSVVREAVYRKLMSLRRQGVVSAIVEHTPGSFVVTLGKMSDVVEAPRRKREKSPPRAKPKQLEVLSEETLELLRTLAGYRLDTLGITDKEKFLAEEMLKEYGSLTGKASAPVTEELLQAMIRRAIDEYIEM